MKEQRALLVGAALVLVVIVITLWRAGTTDDASIGGEKGVFSEQSFATITPAELQQKLREKKNIFLVDIRSQEAFAQKHIADTKHIPFDQLTPENLTSFSGDAVVIVSSAAALESGIADAITKRLGATLLKEKNVRFLAGGIEAWDTATTQTVSAGDPQSFVDHAKVITITPESLKQQFFDGATRPENAVILDVRAPQHYATGHIPSARNIPLDDLETQRTQIPAEKYIIVYGATELESFQAGVRLHDLNFYTTTVLDGGFAIWQEKNFPIEK